MAALTYPDSDNRLAQGVYEAGHRFAREFSDAHGPLVESGSDVAAAEEAFLKRRRWHVGIGKAIIAAYRDFAEKRNELVEAYIPLAWQYANRYSTNGERDELFHLASERLWICATRYDMLRGARFITYASTAIKRKMLTQKKKGGKRAKMEIPFSALAREGDGDHDFADYLAAPGNQYEVLTDKEFVAELLARLTPKQKYLLKLHYGLDDSPCYTLDEIGRTLGVTRERIRQLEGHAVAKLQRYLRLHLQDVGMAEDKVPHRKAKRSVAHVKDEIPRRKSKRRAAA